MKVQFICYPQCNTCKKAKKWLEEHQISFEERHIKDQPPSLEEVYLWQKKAEIPMKKWFNTSGQVYKSLGLSKALARMGAEEQLALLASDGMLVKRPVVIWKERVLVGFNEGIWQEAFFADHV